eukprot:g145.t1
MDNPEIADIKRAGRDEAKRPPQHDWTVENIVMKTVRPSQEVNLKGAIGKLVDATPEEKKAAGLKVEYVTDTEAVKTAVEGAERIVMYIHGIIGDTTEMPKSIRLVQDATGKTLEDNYDLLLTFDYENLNTPIEETAQNLQDRLAAVGLGAGHGKQFDIIAHSMGGLVSRWFIEKLEGNQIVSHLYQLGTPNQGSPYGSLYEMATPLLANAVNGAAFIQPYIIPLRLVGKFLDTMFHTLKQMNADSDFLKELNDGSDPGIPYSIIADHEKAEGTTYRQNTQADEYENELISVDHEALPEASYQARNGQENSATVQQNKRNTEQAELIDFPRKNRL